MQVWQGSVALTEIISYAVTKPVTLNNPPVIGANEINVQFWHGATQVDKSFTLFYIPNGDFPGVGSVLPDWIPTNVGSEIELEDGKLRLGKEHVSNPCTNAPVGMAGVALNIQLPPNSSYYINIAGIVYTQDQNPSNNSTYDAFEILINELVVKWYSNQYLPIGCAVGQPPMPWRGRNL
ncbi:MAG: hypothetical protein IPL78_28990 [Chloroflexi bacterium]|nr:hypothetical protein [Chloroflexota bacterium]